MTADDQRAGYDDDRFDQHSRLLVVQTPAIGHVITCGRRLIQMNFVANTETDSAEPRQGGGVTANVVAGPRSYAVLLLRGRNTV